MPDRRRLCAAFRALLRRRLYDGLLLLAAQPPRNDGPEALGLPQRVRLRIPDRPGVRHHFRSRSLQARAGGGTPDHRTKNRRFFAALRLPERRRRTAIHPARHTGRPPLPASAQSGGRIVRSRDHEARRTCRFPAKRVQQRNLRRRTGPDLFSAAFPRTRGAGQFPVRTAAARFSQGIRLPPRAGIRPIYDHTSRPAQSPAGIPAAV